MAARSVPHHQEVSDQVIATLHLNEVIVLRELRILNIFTFHAVESFVVVKKWAFYIH